MEYSLHEWLEVWMKEYKENFVKKTTGEGYYYIIGLIKANQEDKPLPDFIEMDFQVLVQTLYQKKFSRSTLRKVCYILKASFNCAVRNKILNKNIATELQVPKDASVKDVNALSKEDQRRVEEFCSRHPLGHLIIFLLHTGLRRKELINLKWSDYDEDKNCIYVRESKTKAGERMIPLNKTARKVINDQQRKSEYIFLNTRQQPISHTVLKKLHKKIKEETGIMALTNHMCRNTFATRLVEKKADIKAVSALMGHTNVAFTMRIYVTANEEHLREQVNLLDQ